MGKWKWQKVYSIFYLTKKLQGEFSCRYKKYKNYVWKATKLVKKFLPVHILF